METAGAKRSRRVLIVDDDPTCLEMVCANLGAAGYETLTAGNGVSALAMIHQEQPRIVVSDWVMPEMDGLALCKHIRSGQECLLYFIMLTSQSEKNQLLEAFEAGVDDFLSKPCHAGELLARVRAGSRMVRLYDEMNRHVRALVQSNAELCQANEKLKQLMRSPQAGV